jgi:methylated-DNA-[protein]-cysteine S-methyltransferase
MDKKQAIEALDKYNVTEFQKKVLIATLSIKKGQTKTYKEIARQIGNDHAYRAVGTALKKNPLPILIPCHRVVKSDGHIGNYNTGGKSRKILLLKAEGVNVNSFKY